ncbi:hypothetical protein HELRODRAFT_112230 [Helobdella robusta]|uniref:SUI1 domain-containing protein n=1 Tax=Helobdella robusta TaxID=6412 RepID=T1EFI0_HELRO|nr:hypothetical protein HELRODRAFT_112230 [Helobdella robusta]ESO03303.1 hypothetical protein HELRODRAFT_112230 [Helobdella robusta]
MADTENDGQFIKYNGPVDCVHYPVQVLYCPPDVCDGWPLEYCEYHPAFEKAKEWVEKNLSEDVKELLIDSTAGESGDKKKRQTRGGKAQIKTKQKQDVEKKITLSRSCRGKKKFVTVVSGLSTYEIDLKVASKAFGSRFACGSSVTGDDEIVIQGDIKDDLFDFLVEKWPQIDEDTIEDLGDQKR